MQTKSDDAVRKNMEELRLVTDREIPIQQQRIDSANTSFLKSMELIKERTNQTLENQGKLGKLKVQLREAEDDFVKACAVKTRNEAKRMATMDSLSSTRARIEELKGLVQEQRARKDEYARIISQQSFALVKSEEKGNQVNALRGDIQDAILWYNKVLGFRIECGHGVKFIFTSINLQNPNEEYSFTIRHSNDNYTLLDCDPYLDCTTELIRQLNKTNGLFEFVRVMREKFVEAVESGFVPQGTSVQQVSSTVSFSAPCSSVSTVTESPVGKNEHQVQTGNANLISKKNHGRQGKSAILSPGSAFSPSVRRSPRFVKVHGNLLCVAEDC